MHVCGSGRALGRYLEVVLHVAVGVLGDVQEDEQVLPEVVGHGRQPGQRVLGQRELHHLCGRRTRRDGWGDGPPLRAGQKEREESEEEEEESEEESEEEEEMYVN